MRYRAVAQLSLAISLLLIPGSNAQAQEPNAGQPDTPAQVTDPQATLDTPDTLVYGTTGFFLAPPKLFSYANAFCPPPPPHLAAAAPNVPAGATAAGDPVTIQRIRTTGSDLRTIFLSNAPRDPGVCNPYAISSNVVSDDQNIFWLDAAGLQKLPVTANPGDPPQQLLPAFWGSSDPLELAISPDFIYGYAAGHIWGANKNTGANFEVLFSGDQPSRLSYYDGGLFYIAAGNLRRINLADSSVKVLATGVTAYSIDAARNWVFIGQGKQVVAYNLAAGDFVRYLQIIFPSPPPSPVVFYTSTDNTAVIQRLTADGTHFFVFEQRTNPCPGPDPCFADTVDFLLRVPVTYSIFFGYSGGTPDILYYHENGIFLGVAAYSNLSTDNTFLFWLDSGNLVRLPNDAAALPKINLVPTGVEITQGIQRGDNSVLLVQNRDTYVRAFVRSEGVAVPDVTAHLYASWSGVESSGPIFPENGRITVQPTPDKLDYNQSFVFLLPYEWTQQSDLRLQVVVNPYGVPLEPNYGDNSFYSGPYNFRQSPQLDLIFAEFTYSLNGATFTPQGLLSNVGWIDTAYPLGYNIRNGNWLFGLNYDVWEINDGGLARRVNRMSPECDAFVTYNPDKTIKKDDREFCASDYTNSLLASMRTSRHVPAGTFIYGEIPDSSGAGGQFPRGQAGGSKVSSGPDAPGWNGFYAGHEVGHTVGGGHPATGNTECGLGGGDTVPPYPHAHIGPDDNTVNGFWPGWLNLGGGKWQHGEILKGSDWTDVMAYCRRSDWPRQWISDQNYERFYNNIPKPALAIAAAEAHAPLAGDFLSVYGSVAPDGTGANIAHIRRESSVDNKPPLVPGPYAIRLLGAQANVLADYAFTPGEADDGWPPFGQVVDFVPGTTQVQIVRLAGNTVLAARAVSANLPVVANVATPTPAAANGLALTWTASDPDGDALAFDLLYSRDGGATFQPVQLGVTNTSAEIDTAVLGGSSNALFQVIATDGVNSAFANSPIFTMPAKPPVPHILAPGDGIHVQWGQTVNFSGVALDLQDGSLGGANLVWSNQKGVLGTGALLSLDDLLVGPNTITLAATNSAGLAGSATLTVFVDDDLSVPGPRLSATPPGVAWNVPAASTTVQTAKVNLANTGGGAITWSATGDAPWLTLDAAQGTLPATLTLSGDPSGLPQGLSQTTVTLNALDAGSQVVQTITIPVTLWAGDPGYRDTSVAPPPISAPGSLYLPVIRR